MEYVPGGGLDRRLPMPPGQAARIGTQIADALAALHAEGIVHCDVKPANIGLSRRDNAKLLDFGAAYRLGGTETITVNGPISYTPDYAAPELARGNFPQPASDVFGLGMTLHALVTGHPPRGNAMQDQHLAYWKAEQGVVQIDAQAVGPLYPALTAMLQRDPADRPDAAEAKQLLLEAEHSDRAEARHLVLAAAPMPPASLPPPRPWTRRRAALGGIAASIVAGLVAMILTSVLALASTLFEPASSRTPQGPDQAAPRSLIGDHRTAEPCALADESALSRFGDTELDPAYGAFARCDILVYPGGDLRVDIMISFMPSDVEDALQDPVPARTVGEIGIAESTREPGDCNRALLLPQSLDADTVVWINASIDQGSAPLCAMADAAATSAALQLTTLAENGEQISRRSPRMPADSLIWQDACTLLNADALTTGPGIDPTESFTGFGGWTCGWSSHSGETWVDLRFEREPVMDSEGPPTRLSGHRSFTQPEGVGENTCAVWVEHRDYTDENSETAAEMLLLIVGDERQPMDRLCDWAEGLAAAAAQQLPPT
jgi:hypothetical protein